MNFSDYISRYQWHLVPLAPNSKAPAGVNWGNKGIKTLEALAKAGDRFGLILGPSKMCSIDIDDEQAFSQICDAMGVDIPYQAPTIRGNPQRRKLVYRLPEDLSPIRKVSIGWGSVKNAFELRGTNGSDQLQDVLPPTIHPETKQPYTWSIAPPPTLETWPYLPQEWVDIWENWQAFKEAVNSLDPAFSANKASARSVARILPMPDVINAFNARHSLTELLLKYGYKQCSKNKWISPQSQSKDPGVTVWEKTCYSHHASDGELSGVVCDAFELFSYYEHGSDKKLATKVAAKELGMNKVVKMVKTESETPIIFPDLSKDGKSRILNTIPNLEALLTFYKIAIRENLMTHNLEYSGLECSPKNYSASIKSLCSLHGLSSTKVDEYLDVIADKSKFHPVVDWINSITWDGKKRFDDLLKTLVTDDNPTLVRELLYRWMLGAIEAIYSPSGVRMPGALVLQGLTNIGKTYWMLKLAPEAFVKEGESITTSDKDSIMQVTSRWIVELGEIASTYDRSDINSLKNFITRGSDTYRKAFRRNEQTEPRRTVFFGSVNEQSYLVDKTGNRRWWTISVNAVNSYHQIDMGQLWAEMLVYYKNGETCALSKETERLLAEHNKQFEVRDYLHDLVLNRYKWNEPVELHREKGAQEILKELCPGESLDTYNRMYKRLATVLQEGFRLKMRKTGKANVYLMPPLVFN